MASPLRCPVCGESLARAGRAYRCASGHSFDVAHQGYVNLLPTARRRARVPGDNREMIVARRDFLDLGHFDRVSEALNRVVAVHLPAPRDDEPLAILDAGAGEGFYVARLATHLRATSDRRVAFDVYGVDVSKYAMQYATHRARDLVWVVANSTALPFADSSLDVVLSVFAPAPAAEFRRVLRPSGGLIVARPGPGHLRELRAALYKRVAPDDQAPLLAELAGRFLLRSTSRVAYEIEVGTARDVGSLLTMTPFGWNIDPARRAQVESLAPLRTQVDLTIWTFGAGPPRPDRRQSRRLGRSPIPRQP